METRVSSVLGVLMLAIVGSPKGAFAQAGGESIQRGYSSGANQYYESLKRERALLKQQGKTLGAGTADRLKSRDYLDGVSNSIATQGALDQEYRSRVTPVKRNFSADADSGAGEAGASSGKRKKSSGGGALFGSGGPAPEVKSSERGSSYRMKRSRGTPEEPVVLDASGLPGVIEFQASPKKPNKP